MEENQPKRKSKLPLVTGLTGMILGAGLTMGLDIITSPTKEARIMKINDTPQIMKVYNSNEADSILVENLCNFGEYVTLRKYLKEFDNKYERNFEKAKIELMVSKNEAEKE